MKQEGLDHPIDVSGSHGLQCHRHKFVQGEPNADQH